MEGWGWMPAKHTGNVAMCEHNFKWISYLHDYYVVLSSLIGDIFSGYARMHTH